MGQLLKQINGNHILWSRGCASFFMSYQIGFWNLPMAVKCRVGSLEATDLALLDTGVEWSVIGGEVAEILEDEIGLPTESFSISTRLGKISGSLHRIPISLLAEQNNIFTIASFSLPNG